jgi:hypothetical protein
VNYSLKVVELVSLLLVVNYVVDFMNVCDIVLCMIYPEYSAYFGCSPSNEVAKIGNGKKNKTLIFISWGHGSAPGSNIFIGWGHGSPLRPNIFIS